MLKKILFVTGTRADFGKLKPLIRKLYDHPKFEVYIFVTGMHTLLKYGNTMDEVLNSFPDRTLSSGFRNIHVFRNQIYDEPMEQILANTIQGFSRYIVELQPDLIIVHGDRIETLACAIAGAIKNILVAHIEGGELSGTIDELLRHSTSKMSHIHFVSNEMAAKRLRQLGENDDSIFIIGSPDIDLMLSQELPTLAVVKKYYEISYDQYGVVIFHPVTTDLEGTKIRAKSLVTAIDKCREQNFVVIYPNNDQGSSSIFLEYEKLKKLPNVRLIPSMRIEYFLTLLKNSKYILGNSSAGIMEAPVYGIPTINIDNRQQNRHFTESIHQVLGGEDDLIAMMKNVYAQKCFLPDYTFGDGKSADRFLDVLQGSEVWEIPTQKQFRDS